MPQIENTQLISQVFTLKELRAQMRDTDTHVIKPCEKYCNQFIVQMRKEDLLLSGEDRIDNSVAVLGYKVE